ncbi:MAG: hypothetical protein ACTSR1_03675 [Candidatus Heimdallarchaeota archaeon]
MTTHDPEMARRADRILIFKNGQLVEEKIQDKETFDFRAAKEIYKRSIEDDQKPSDEKEPAKKKTKKKAKKS